MSNKIDLTGQRFERWSVLKVAENKVLKNGQSVTAWLCKCDCGKEKIVITNSLRGNRSKSCGCIRIEAIKKHGLEKHPIYQVWNNMRQRCYNPKADSFKFYNTEDRNIIICEEWINNPEVFIKWALGNGWRKGLQIDRIKNEGNYEPSNCHFVTSRINALNKRLISSRNKSGYSGVHFGKNVNKWISSIRINYKLHHLGCFEKIEQAIKVRNNYIIEKKLEHEYKIQEYHG